MVPRTVRIRIAAVASLALTAVLMSGCAVEVIQPVYDQDESLGMHFGDGYLATMFGNTLVDIWAGGQVVGDPVVVMPDAPMVITATFHDAAANMIMSLSEYELRMDPSDPLVSFKRTGALAGTLTRVAPGTTLLMVGLHNTQRQLEDFGPFPVPVTVR